MIRNYLRRSLKKLHKRHYVLELLFLAIIVLVILIGIKFVLMGRERLRPSFPKTTESFTAPQSSEINQGLNRRAIDGVFVKAGQERQTLVGVIIENMIEAQPISGIDKANLVFEAVTEANITRLLAIFTIKEGKEGEEGEDGDFQVGPVRSARPYYLDWAAELGVLFAHVGGSPEANSLIKQGAVKDLDQWFKSQYFWRTATRSGPHNVYTKMTLLASALEKEKFKQEEFENWQFKDDTPRQQRGDISEIKINYIAPYNVTWQYDKELNEYIRYQWGGEHKTAEDNLIKAKNIAISWLPMKILDEIGRKWFGTIGEGRAVVFRDGQAIEGVWRKSSREERMKFFNESGQEIEFNAGTTWIEIVPEKYQVEY